MKKQSQEDNRKEKVKKQIERIRAVFNMSPESIKKHPQLKKIQEYLLEEKKGEEKYAIGCYGKGDCYIVYKPEYEVYAKEAS